jgi:hypothetical protein
MLTDFERRERIGWDAGMCNYDYRRARHSEVVVLHAAYPVIHVLLDLATAREALRGLVLHVCM